MHSHWLPHDHMTSNKNEITITILFEWHWRLNDLLGFPAVPIVVNFDGSLLMSHILEQLINDLKNTSFFSLRNLGIIREVIPGFSQASSRKKYLLVCILPNRLVDFACLLSNVNALGKQT